MLDSETLQLHPLGAGDLDAAARLLGRAMRDNPLHVAVFGAAVELRERRLRRFFAAVLPWILRCGWMLGAFQAGQPVGLIGALPPGACRARALDLARMAVRLASGEAPRTLIRIQRWRRAWQKRDPDHPHWHLGPLATEPALQRRGLGGRLLEACRLECESVDAPLYLETDRAGNVDFYRRAGFAIRAEARVLDVPCWFLQRH